ncbi:hypothetical protein VKT23_006085 [Stygiomarasmius scandens]|uniref:Uncharacterized protein n=1 Tax=Marasmiellus scandens TaxID=2682957 RepID=A0ABR1JPZ9_9AGAR
MPDEPEQQAQSLLQEPELEPQSSTVTQLSEDAKSESSSKLQSNIPGLEHRSQAILPRRLLGRAPPRNSILKMLGYMLAALLLAVGHHLYYKHLHMTPSESTSSIGNFTYSAQTKERFITDIFVLLTRLCFGLAISTAFEQRLWYSVSHKPIALDGIDALFGIVHDPLLFRKVAMFTARIACILAILSWTVSYGILPVPGALSVQSIETVSFASVVVPTINLDQPVNNTVYKMDPIGNYSGPSLTSIRLAGQTITSGNIPGWTSPCGANCSYDLTFAAPSFICQQPGTSRIESKVPSWNAESITTPDSDSLSLQWMSIPDAELSNTTCSAISSTYNITVSYNNNEQKIKLGQIERGQPFGTGTTIIGQWNISLAQLAAMKDSLTTVLTGSIFEDSQIISVTGQTLAHYSPLLLSAEDLAGTPIFKPESGKLVEDLMKNVSVGFMSLNLWHTTVDAKTSTAQNLFIYNSHILWAGYGTCFGVAFVAVIIGLHAVWRNGGSGGTNFSLMIGTTRNPDLDLVVWEALGNREAAEGLKKLPLQYMEGVDGRLAFRSLVQKSAA